MSTLRKRLEPPLPMLEASLPSRELIVFGSARLVLRLTGLPRPARQPNPNATFSFRNNRDAWAGLS